GLGSTMVTLIVTDSVGLSSTSQATVTVEDKTLPTIVCPPNQMMPATSGSGAVVPYPAPTVADNCPGVTAGCSQASGATFPIGTTLVQCTATDTSTNKVECSFTVKVKGAADQTTDLINLVKS